MDEGVPLGVAWLVYAVLVGVLVYRLLWRRPR
jgi:hypothetical protein